MSKPRLDVFFCYYFRKYDAQMPLGPAIYGGTLGGQISTRPLSYRRRGGLFVFFESVIPSRKVACGRGAPKSMYIGVDI